MKRRTLRPLRTPATEHHYHVYVVLLNRTAVKLRHVKTHRLNRDSQMPSVYVGMTGLTPAERFTNHKAGIKAAAVVTRCGIRLLPELDEHLNPMPFEAAVQMEAEDIDG